MFVYRFFILNKGARPATVEHAEWQAKMNEVSHLAELIIETKTWADYNVSWNLKKCSPNLDAVNN